MRAASWTGALVTLGVWVLLACSGCTSQLAPLSAQGTHLPPSLSPNATPAPPPVHASTTPTPIASTYPITGLPAARSSDLTRPAVAVVVDVSGTTVPVGLQSADMVVEEVLQPGSERLLAVFQSRDAPAVGPVGEARPVDSVLLPGWRAMYAYSGGKSTFVDQARDAGAIDVGRGVAPDAYTRTPNGRGFLVSVKTARRAPQAESATPAWTVMSIVSPAAAPAAAHTHPAAEVVVRPPGQASQTWTWDSRTERYQNRAMGVAVANLVIRTVPYKSLSLADGTTEPSARVLGSGKLRVASHGRVVRGTWVQQQADAQVRMFTGDTVIGLAPGPTWVLLAPDGTTVRTGAGGD